MASTPVIISAEDDDNHHKHDDNNHRYGHWIYTVTGYSDNKWIGNKSEDITGQPMTTVNIFTNYQQEENLFTNGLVALLELSRHERPPFAKTFL